MREGAGFLQKYRDNNVAGHNSLDIRRPTSSHTENDILDGALLCIDILCNHKRKRNLNLVIDLYISVGRVKI